MAKYGKKEQSKVKRAMHERKHGTLESGRSGKKVTSRKQAIAIGLSEARAAGAKVPRHRSRKGGKKRCAAWRERFVLPISHLETGGDMAHDPQTVFKDAPRQNTGLLAAAERRAL